MKTLTVVVCVPHSEPVVREIDDTLQAMQACVGGHIQILPRAGLRRGLAPFDVYVNEDGLGLGLPFNRELDGHVLVGPIVVSKSDRAGAQVSLTTEDVARIREALLAP